MFNYVKPNQNMKTLSHIHGRLILEQNQIAAADTLFSWSRQIQAEYYNTIGTVRADTNFHNPNYQLFYFNTISNPQLAQAINILHHTNMAIPVSHTLDHEKKKLLSRVLGLDPLKENKYGYVEGIYIAEYYRMTRSHLNEGVTAYNYMINGKGFIADPQNEYGFKEAIMKTLNNHGRCDYERAVDVRVIYFVPKQELIDNDSVYIPKLNIVIANMLMNQEVYHPLSYAMTHDIEGLSFDNAASITFEIVKNRQNPDEPNCYYVRSGKDIVTIKVTYSDTREEGAYKKEYLNGMETRKEFCELAQMGKQFGIYPSKELAEADGNIENIMALKRTENENTKLELEKEKLKVETEKLGNEVKRLDYACKQLELEKDKLQQERYKLELEKEFLEKKYEFELDMAQRKLDVSNMEIDKKKLDDLMFMKKSFLDFEYQKRKIVHDLEMSEIDIAQAKINHEKIMERVKLESNARFIAFATTAIGSTVGLIKLLK